MTERHAHVCVVVKHTFDPDVTVYECDSDEEAEDLMVRLYVDYLREEQENNSELDDNGCYCSRSEAYARLTWADGDYTDFSVVQAIRENKKKEE